MAKLIVLSEIDNLKYLNLVGIYPNEFYTDFEMFKNKSSTFYDAHIIVFFVGSCNFSKRHVTDVLKGLSKRAENESDKGILSLTIFSDGILQFVDKYYKFENSLDTVSEYKGWKLRVKNSKIVDKLYKGVVDERCQKFLCYRDEGYAQDLKDAYKSLEAPDESLRKLIKKPVLE